MELSEKIHFLRKQQGLTLEQVAEHVGVGKSTVRKWETGIIQNMRRDKIALLAEALHTTPYFLMGWDDDPTDYESSELQADLCGPAMEHLIELHNGDIAAATKAKLEADRLTLEEAQKKDPQIESKESLRRMMIDRGVIPANRDLTDAEVNKLMAIAKAFFESDKE